MMMSEENSSTLYDVVVVGAGLSGLTAAYTLLKINPHINVLILEAKDRVGGRTLMKTLKCARNDKTHSETVCDWEFGGMWVGRCQTHIMSLLEDLDIGTYKQYTTGFKCMKFSDDDRVKTYDSNIPSMGVLSTLDIGQALLRIERLIKTVPVEDPWSCANASELDSITVEAMKRKYCFTNRAREALDTAVRTVFGVEPSQISALYFLAYCSAAGSLQKVIESTEQTAQEYKIKGGTQNVCKKLIEDRITWQRIKLNCPVRKITQIQDRVNMTISSGETLTTKYVIMATPPTQTINIEFSPNLPYKKQHLLKRMPVGHIIKTIITYRQAHWKEKGFSGEIVTTDPVKILPEGCTSGPVGIAYDATSEHENPAVVVFTCGKQAEEWGMQSFEIRKKAVLSSLAQFYQCEDMLNPIDYGEKDWAQETYNGGCPVYTVTPGVMKYYAELRKPHDRIEFAGSESATAWSGFLSGAVQAGQRAAETLLDKLNKQQL